MPVPVSALGHLEHKFPGYPAADLRLFQPGGDVLRVDIRAKERDCQVRTAEDVCERQRIRGPPARKLRQRVKAMLNAELEQLVIGQDAALIGDVIADERYAAVGGEEQGAIKLLEKPAARV